MRPMVEPPRRDAQTGAPRECVPVAREQTSAGGIGGGDVPVGRQQER